MDSQEVSKIILYFVILYINTCLPLPSTKIYTVESGKVCSQVVNKKHLHLGKNNASSILVKETRYFDTWLGDHAFTCKFKVEAEAPESGVFAVIQKLSMRIDPSTGKCVDYVQFRPSSKKSWGPKVCGKVSAFSPDMKFVDSTLSDSVLASNSCIATDGRMDVNIHVANQKLEFDDKIDIDIAFTSYKACSKSDQYRSCYDDHSSRLFCIWNGFFYDNIVNCPFHHCTDEGGCREVHGTEDIGISHGSSPAVVTGAAVATLLIVFGSFLACIWLLRKLHLLCWSFPGSSAQQTAAVEFSGHGLREEVFPAAPSLDMALQPISPDKDEPPAYDTLFPPKPT